MSVLQDKRSKRGKLHYIEFRDQGRRIRKFYGYPGNRNHKASLEVEAKLLRLVECKAAGLAMPDDLRQFIDGLPDRHKNTLVGWELLPPGLAAGSWPLDRHIPDWETGQRAKNCHERYVRGGSRKLRALADQFGWRRLSDLLLHGQRDLESWMAEALRQGKSKATINQYVISVKSFCSKMMELKRLPENPARHIKLLHIDDADTDRAELSPEQQIRLIEAAEQDQGKLRRLTGRDWAMRIRFSLWIGIRWNELRQLRRENIRLDGDNPGVTIPDEIAKHHHGGFIPLHPAAVALLGEYFRERPVPPQAPAFPIPRDKEGSAILAHYLAKAGIPKEADGRKLVWHSLRIMPTNFSGGVKRMPIIAPISFVDGGSEIFTKNAE